MDPICTRNVLFPGLFSHTHAQAHVSSATFQATSVSPGCLFARDPGVERVVQCEQEDR